MQDYSEFPPLKYFIRVLKSCPQSAFIYLQIWKKGGKKMRLITFKKQVRKEYLISKTVFRNLLAQLMLLSLIHFEELEDQFQIEILGPHLNEA